MSSSIGGRARLKSLFAFLITLPLIASAASAQITPQKLYNGVHRPLKMSIALPKDADADRLVVQLIEGVSLRVIASTDVRPGEIDLAERFPQLWTTDQPRVWFAQLAQRTAVPATAPAEPAKPDETAKPLAPTSPPAARTPEVLIRVGPAVVLQPMLSPARAAIEKGKDGKPRVVFPKEQQPKVNAYTGIRAYVDKHVHLDTDAGEIEFRLRPDFAPNTSWNIRQLADGGFYDDVEFHRVVPVGRGGKGFVIQGGDPTGTGEGTPGYEIQYEASNLPHDFGVVSMARDDDPNTNGCQFFICLSRDETARLDGLYTAFGQTIDGPSVKTIRAIAAGKLLPGEADRPERPVKITKAVLVDAPPIGLGPGPAKVEQPGR